MNKNPPSAFPKWAILVAIVGVFALPILIAGLWYMNVNQWGVGRTMNYGHLITPPIRLHIATLPLIVGHGHLTSRYFRGRWTLVYIGGVKCTPDCRAALYATRQIRLALGEDIRRVQRLYVVTGEPQKLGFLEVEDPDLTIVRAEGTRGGRFIHQFFKAANAHSGERIYLVDPMGNLMMSYPAAVNPHGLMRDLKRLLSVSEIG
ncbi:MAG: SCO family protein [Gammaproteobacteria bacterium]